LVTAEQATSTGAEAVKLADEVLKSSPPNQASALFNELSNRMLEVEDPDATRAKEDFEFFVTRIFSWKLKPFHQQMCYTLQHMPEKYLFLLPRGFGKSSLCSVAWPLWLLASRRDIRILLVSNVLRLASEWMRQIENVMLHNAQYRKWFGNLVPDARRLTWTDTEKVVLGRSPMATHTSLYAIGSGGSALGKRSDIIIADDLLEPEAGTLTPLQVERITRWFWNILQPILEPENSSIVVVGTRHGQLDFYESLKYEKKWPCLEVAALDEKGQSVWPERFSTVRLDDRKESMGSYNFDLQFMNRVTDANTPLRADWIRYWLDRPDVSELTIFQGIDPALSMRESADFFVITTAGVTKEHNRIYLLDMVRTKAKPMRQIELIKEQAALWKPVAIGIESNAAQALLSDYVSETSLLPIRKMLTKTDKLTRFISMSILFESGRVLTPGIRESEGVGPIPQFAPFVAEWTGFPRSSHDDTLDSVAKVLELSADVGPPAASAEASVPTEVYNKYVSRVPAIFVRSHSSSFIFRRGRETNTIVDKKLSDPEKEKALVNVSSK
jgi:predicted phage terminase large subunit-like protein